MRNSILKHKLGAVIVAALISIIILTFIFIFRDELKEFGTLLTLIASAPVAFVIWVIRDENVTQQIENARKDTNLKEFQKLAEWVSGAHLIEDKVIEKSINENGDIETIREYTDISKELSIPTFSKKDGAVGLQISAVYNLLPFYRGEHGESFKKPALNLLISTWKVLQKEKSLKNVKKNASSPLGTAITRVLLSLNDQNKICLLDHKEIFPVLYLVGMSFIRVGVDNKILNLFDNLDCRGIDLTMANLRSVSFKNTKLQNAKFNYAKLKNANFTNANLEKTDFTNAKHLETVDFTVAKNIDKAIGLPPEIVEKYKAKTEN